MAAGSDVLMPNESLKPNEWLESASRKYRLVMQSDGNLVLYKTYRNMQRALWDSGTVGRNVVDCVMQSDGNLVVYGPSGQPHWASKTVGSPSKLIVQDDGNLVIYRMNGQAAWNVGPDFEVGVVNSLKRIGGCAGGVAIYYAAQAACNIANPPLAALRHKPIKLWKDTKRVMSKYFPRLDLSRVEFRNNCRLPGNWFQREGWVAGMTFGYDIFFRGKDYQQSRQGLKHLMHELVHVDQVRRQGSERGFACAYGKAYLKAGNYYDSPMEVEADLMVTKNGDALPDGCRRD
jgi:hypothetical protein